MLEYIEKIVASRDVEELWSHHKEVMASYGFTRLIYGYTSQISGRNLGDRQDITVLSTLKPDYMAAFLDGGLYFHAPMVRWGIENTGARSWRWISELAERGALEPEARRVYELNAAHDFLAGMTLSFPSSSERSRAGIGLAPEPGVGQDEVDEIWERHGRELWALNNVAHLKITTLPGTSLRRPLTARQREVLEWVGNGKTNADIALIMGLTPATVEKHLRLARDALAVETTAQAVLKASLLNQIYLVERGN